MKLENTGREEVLEVGGEGGMLMIVTFKNLTGGEMLVTCE